MVYLFGSDLFDVYINWNSDPDPGHVHPQPWLLPPTCLINFLSSCLLSLVRFERSSVTVTDDLRSTFKDSKLIMFDTRANMRTWEQTPPPTKNGEGRIFAPFSVFCLTFNWSFPILPMFFFVWTEDFLMFAPCVIFMSLYSLWCIYKTKIIIERINPPSDL